MGNRQHKSFVSIHLSTVNSTNNWVKNHLRTFSSHAITRVSAEEQTAGRGQHDRVWVSPRGQNLYVTYFATISKQRENVQTLAHVFCLILHKLLQYHHLPSVIKWPNDLFVRGKKIGGVLGEIVDLGEEYGVILGGGLNVNMPAAQCQAIDQPATSLLCETGLCYPLHALLGELDGRFCQEFSLYENCGFAPFRPQCEPILLQVGESITLKWRREIVSGRVISLHPSGGLHVLLSNGHHHVIHSREELLSSPFVDSKG